MGTAMEEFKEACEKEAYKDVAIKLIKKGIIAYEDIAGCTGLALEEVKELAEGISA